MKSLSIRTYLLVFLLLSCVAFVFEGIYTLQKMHTAQLTVNQHNTNASRDEMMRAVKRVIKVASQAAETITVWDETFQQLDDPTYYVYWRNQRLRSPGKFPVYVKSIELYGKDKLSLTRLPYAEFPDLIPPLNLYLEKSNEYFLYIFKPIISRDDNTTTTGYVGLKINFLKALLDQSRFVYTNTESIKINSSNNRIPESELIHHIQFRALTSPSSKLLEAVIYDNLIHSIIILVSMLALVIWFTHIFISHPLRLLVTHIDNLRKGDINASYGTDGKSNLPVMEINTLTDSIQTYHNTLEKVHSRLDKQNIELQRLAHNDPLTGVHNRRAFEEDWQHLLELIEDQRVNVSFILFDCDHFKAINDSYGHDVGDKVIQIIAESLDNTLRKGDKLYRMGGDEFSALLINSDRETTEEIAYRCLEIIQQYPFQQLGIKEPVKLSVGLSHAAGTDMSRLTELHKQADIAMYHAKGATNKVAHYTPEMGRQSSALISSRIISAVLAATDTGLGINMHYQPVVTATSNKVHFYEALLRLYDDDGIIHPSEIFRVIDRHSLDVKIDTQVIKKVARDIENNSIPDNPGISINLSAATLVAKNISEIIAPLSAQLHKTKLVIEITETSLITHLQFATDNLQLLREQGFIIALDDFGSGYSSIRYLANMPVDIVKFDIAMIQDMNKDKRTRIIIEHTAKLILDAGYQLVAEGIETEDTRQDVINMGATYLQGYLFGRAKLPGDIIL